MMLWTSGSASGETPPKLMRKGTRSCAECRRRKIRCVFRTPDHATCQHCEARGVFCLEQRRDAPRVLKARSQLDLQERVAKLESLLAGSVLPDDEISIPHGASSRQVHNVNATPITSSENRLERLPSAPLLNSQPSPASLDSSSDSADLIAALFDNGIWQRSTLHGVTDNGKNVSEPATGHVTQKILMKRVRSRMALLVGIPSPELLSDILNETCSWWKWWRPLGSCSSYRKEESLQDFVLRTAGSDKPPIVGLALLCIAVSIQQLDRETNSHLIRQLGNSPGELFQKYFDRVHRIIVNDSDYAVSLEGIEVIMLSSKLMMWVGVIKSSWMLCRKALTYAQLLGMHRPQRSSPTAPDLQVGSQQHVWESLCQQDAYLSLVLALPYGFYEKAIPSTLQTQDAASRFNHEMLKLSVRAIDRTQMGLNLSPEIANDIQKDLELAASTMPQEFWGAPHALANGSVIREAYLESIAAQFWYHQIRVSVQMQSIQNQQLEAHRAACLEASRDLLKVYHIMRSESNSSFEMVSVIDYQAFICSALLILGMLGYGNSGSITETENQNSDQELIQLTLVALRRSAKATADTSTASQAFQGLETLTLLASRDRCSYIGGQDIESRPYVKVIVPYSGTITVSPGYLIRDGNCTPHIPKAHPPPTFTFLDYDQTQQFPKETAPGVDNIGYDRSLDFGNMESEFPPIDFDWNTVMNTNFDESWAWLTDLHGTM